MQYITVGGPTGPARVVAVGAVLAAVIIVGFTLLGGGGAYRVHARFVNASQLVKGNLVQVAGPAGRHGRAAST